MDKILSKIMCVIMFDCRRTFVHCMHDSKSNVFKFLKEIYLRSEIAEIHQKVKSGVVGFTVIAVTESCSVNRLQKAW